MRKALLLRILFLVLVGIVWYLRYPQLLLHHEETAYFANTADFYHLYYTLPGDILKIVAQYLSQFYMFPWAGALLQVLGVALILGSCDWILYCMFRSPGWLWFSFIPASLMAIGQLESISVYESVCQVVGLWMGAGILCLLHHFLPWRDWSFSFPKRTLRSVLDWVVPLLCLFLTCFVLLRNKRGRYYEKIQRIEHLAMDSQWERVLAEVPDGFQGITKVSLRYYLLALSETGRLGDQLFRFPVSNFSDFYFTEKNPVTFRFNSLFFWHLGMSNEALRYVFQECQKGETGLSFAPLRRMTDWYMQRGDKRQAAYYLNLLSHSLCHGSFIRTRRIFMDQAPRSDIQKALFFSSSNLMLNASYVLELDHGNERALNYLLCCFLLERDIESFYDVFKVYWPAGMHIPVHYEEALLLLADRYPEIKELYMLSEGKQKEYAGFKEIIRSSPDKNPLLLMKYKDTFWFYHRLSANTDKRQVMEDLPVSRQETIMNGIN